MFRGVSESNLKDIVIEYFNLEMNYREIKNKLSRVDNYLKESKNEERKSNSGAFNDVLKAYCRKAMQNCNVDSETISNVMNEVKWLLDTVSANEIIKQ